MHKAIICMDKTIAKITVFRETRFRTPGVYERRAGLWVDRIGSARDAGKDLCRLRILGQCAVVAVESGAGVLITQSGGRYPVQAGDAFLLLPEEPAVYGPDRTWFSRWILWNGPLATTQLDIAGLGCRGPVLHRAAEIVRPSFYELLRLMDIEDRAAALERQAVILNMLAGLFRLQSAGNFKASGPGLEAAIGHIRRRLGARLTVGELAAVSRLSVPHFRRMFRRHTGRSPVEFIMAARISRAKDLLLRGASIKEAAEETGFADQFYFMRVFRNVAGQTAGEFIRGMPRAPARQGGGGL